MKKKLLFLGAMLIAVFTIGFATVRAAEGEEPIVPAYTSTVVVGETKKGTVTVDITEGNVGDTCTVTVEPALFCLIDTVYANGTQLLAREDGTYQFVLVDGENTLNANFKVDMEQLQPILDMVDQAKDEGFASLFTMRNFATLISFVISLFMSGALLTVASKYSKVKEASVNEVKEAVGEATVANFEPRINRMEQSAISTEQAIQALVKCFMLMQEGTPEARLAIIDELNRLKLNGADLIEQIKSAIKEEVNAAQESVNARKNAILELEQANNSLGTENAQKEPKNDVEGRY